MLCFDLINSILLNLLCVWLQRAMMMLELICFRAPTSHRQHQHLDEGDSSAAGQGVQTSGCVMLADHLLLLMVIALYSATLRSSRLAVHTCDST